MLPPDSRAVLIEALRPPAGFAFEGAIATTFTLDLTAAVIPPLAFSSFGLSSKAPDPVTTLEAVRAAAARVDIFCQGGNIVIPAKAPDLLAFVEPMVHAVRRPSGYLFHPKTWFVRYVDESGNEAYRLLVLTRNLTNERAWDIMVRLDSEDISSRRLSENRELHQFLAGLPGRTIAPLSRGRARRVESLAHAAQYVAWNRPEGVSNLRFHFLDGTKRLDLSGRRHLVVSPFLNDAGLDAIASRSQQLTVVSRAEEFERLAPDQVERLEPYIVDAMAGIVVDDGDVEPITPLVQGSATAAPTTLLRGLHAKLFVVEPDGRALRARVLIGSANATSAALGGNVEFMVEIEGPRRLFGVDAFMGADGSFRTLVEPYPAMGGAQPDPDEQERWELENRLRVIAEVRHTLTVQSMPRPTQSVKREYALLLTTNRPYPVGDDWAATVELLTRPGIAHHAQLDQPFEAAFLGVETPDISPFVSVRITSPSGLQGGTVVLATILGDPADRLDLVLARQIDTPEKFMRFLYLMLSLGNPALLANSAGGAPGSGGWGSQGGPGVLELVLRALADKPDALADLGRLVHRLSATEEGRQLLPVGFDSLWSEVEAACRQLAKAR